MKNALVRVITTTSGKPRALNAHGRVQTHPQTVTGQHIKFVLHNWIIKPKPQIHIILMQRTYVTKHMSSDYQKYAAYPVRLPKFLFWENMLQGQPLVGVFLVQNRIKRLGPKIGLPLKIL